LERALDFSPRSAEIKIVISSDQALARLTVSAPGMAMPPDGLDHGVGALSLLKAKRQSFRRDLSLPVAAKIVSLHGGRLTNSSDSESASLTMYLPAFASSVVESQRATSPRPGGVLIVDDDYDCREVLKEVLEEEGFPVFTAASAAIARSMLEEIRPALVLLDLHLSDGDGRVVLRHIRQRKELKETPVYIISGASDGAAIASQKGGDRIDGFFEKPIRLPRLLETVSSIVQAEKAAVPPLRASKRESP
jgi:CheY-like chemotaxis protein